MIYTTERCTNCGGSGWTPVPGVLPDPTKPHNGANRCWKCSGTGRVSVKEKK